VARGVARASDGDTEGALKDFTEAVKLNPNSAGGLQDQASILADRLGRNAEALAPLDRLLGLYPDFARARGARAVRHRKLHRPILLHLRRTSARRSGALYHAEKGRKRRVADARRRIDEATDPVRVEVETALREGVRVLPVLVDGARMPTEDELPDGLKDLAFINAAPVDTGRDFRQHLERVLRAMDEILVQRQALPSSMAPAALRLTDLTTASSRRPATSPLVARCRSTRWRTQLWATSTRSWPRTAA